METLSDKLKALGVSMGAKQIPQPVPASSFPIESVVNIKSKENIFGKTLFTEIIYPGNYQHGIINFSDNINPTKLMEWGRLESGTPTSLDKFLFFDTETTGLAGGAGTFAFLIGIGFWEEKEFHVVQFFLPEPIEESAMLAGFDEIITSFRVLVSFNGKTFDAPLLNARHVLNCFQLPFTDKSHLDLLHLARRIWRDRLPSRALANLEKDILFYSRTEEEIPGWMIPDLYLEYLRTKDARPLKGVFYHNSIDILSLAALFVHTSKLLENPIQPEMPGLDIVAVAKIYEDLQQYEKALDCYEAGLTAGLPPQYYAQTLLRFADLYRRQDKINLSLSLWEKASGFGEIAAIEELAKYYEHNLRDLQSALLWADRGLSSLSTLEGFPEWEKKFLHRKERLEFKIRKQAR